MSVQRVNFYQPQFHVKQDYLSARFFPLYAAALAIALFTASSVLKGMEKKLSNELSTVQGEMAAVSSQLEELSKRFREIPKDDSLEGKVASMEQELDRKEKVITLLAGRQLGNPDGFSPMLMGLARNPVKGVWLNTMMFRRGGNDYILTGKARKTELLPEFIDQLLEQPGFTGHPLKALMVGLPSPNADQLDFVLSTHDVGELRTILKSLKEQAKGEGKGGEGKDGEKGDDKGGAREGMTPFVMPGLQNLPPGMAPPVMLPPGMLPQGIEALLPPLPLPLPIPMKPQPPADGAPPQPPAPPPPEAKQ